MLAGCIKGTTPGLTVGLTDATCMTDMIVCASVLSSKKEFASCRMYAILCVGYGAYQE